jgi:hypothetical protein
MLTTVNLTSRIGTDIKADCATLRGGAKADSRELIEQRAALDSGRMMHRTALQGEEPLA